MGKDRQESALYVLMSIYAPILKFWKTVYLLLTRTEEYHRNPSFLFADECISRKRVLKWSTFTYTAIGIAVALSVTHPYNFKGLLLQSLLEKAKTSGFTWLDSLSVLLPGVITGVLLVRLFLFGPIVLIEVVCRKLYKTRRPVRRFVFSAAPLYALVNFVESVVSFAFSLIISFILQPKTAAETASYQKAGIGIWYIFTLWFGLYMLPRHLAYQYRLSLYKAAMLCYIAPMMCVFYVFIAPFGYFMYFVGWLLNVCFTLVFPLSWPFVFRRLRTRIREGGWRSILFANRERGEPRLGPRWLTLLIIVLCLLYMYYSHTQMEIPDEHMEAPVQDVNYSAQ